MTSCFLIGQWNWPKYITVWFNFQVQLTLLTAIVKLFLKKPSETQELVQQVLSLATQVSYILYSKEVHLYIILMIHLFIHFWMKLPVLYRVLHSDVSMQVSLLQDSDNPDLRDRGYIYWRLLSTDPVTAKEVVLSEKPLISEETDLIEPTLLDELICHIGSLASVYHKPPSAFVEGSHGIHRKHLPVQHSRSDTRAHLDYSHNDLTAFGLITTMLFMYLFKGFKKTFHKIKYKMTSFWIVEVWVGVIYLQIISVGNEWFVFIALPLPVYCFLLWQHWYRWEPSERWAGSCHGAATCDPQPGWPAGWPAQPGPGPSSQCAPSVLHANGCSGPFGRRPGQLGELHLNTHTHALTTHFWPSPE